MSDSQLQAHATGPVTNGTIRASDADREQVATVLSTAYAEGRLSRDEHDERLTRTMAAKTFDDLVPVTHDLVVMAPSPRPAAPAGQPGYLVDTTATATGPDRMVAIFSGVTRKGRWRVPRSIQSLAVFGGVDLDLTQATFESPVVEITGFWCFGGVDIKVPPGVGVQDQVVGIFGGSEVKDVGDPQPGAPTLVVRGLALFAGVSVKGPRTGWRRHR